MTDPKATGNRPNGWGFAHNASRPKFLGDHVDHGDDDLPWRTRISADGQIVFTVERDMLDREAIDSKTRDLWPYMLLEFPMSVFRLMAKVIERFGGGPAGREVVALLALGEIQGWRLRPGSPREPLPPWKQRREFEERALLVGPLSFPAGSFPTEYGRYATRLIRLIYARFGFEEDDIPKELDRQTGVLRLG